MGKVFTFEQIKRGDVPTLSCFDVVRSEVVGELRNHELIVAAAFCGSAAYARHAGVHGYQVNLRSDIDVVCFFSNCSDKEFWESLMELQIFAASKHVPLDLIPRHVDLMKTPLHDFGPGFVQHLQKLPSSGQIKGDIRSCIVDLQISLREDLLGWLRQKVRSLQKYYGVYQFATHAEQCLYFEKTLSTAVHFARRLLQLPQFSLEVDDKTAVIKAYGEQIQSEDLCERFRALVQLSRDYNKELKFQIDTPDEVRYRKYIASQAEALLEAKDFLMQHAPFFV